MTNEELDAALKWGAVEHEPGNWGFTPEVEAALNAGTARRLEAERVAFQRAIWDAREQRARARATFIRHVLIAAFVALAVTVIVVTA